MVSYPRANDGWFTWVEPGKLAALVAFSLDSPSDDPLESLGGNPAAVRVLNGDGPAGRQR